MNIQKIPLEKLYKDKQDSIDDIKICENALKNGIRTYSGGHVQTRINNNKRIIKKINAELIRSGDMTKENKVREE